MHVLAAQFSPLSAPMRAVSSSLLAATTTRATAGGGGRGGGGGIQPGGSTRNGGEAYATPEAPVAAAPEAFTAAGCGRNRAQHGVM